MLDAVDRVQRIIELLSSCSNGLTISDIARGCEVDVSVIRNDLVKMELEYQLFPLWSDQDGSDDMNDNLRTPRGDEINWTERGRDQAFSDNARWSLRPDYPQLYPVYFTPEEFLRLAELLSILPESSSISSILKEQVSTILGDDLASQQLVQYTKGNLDPYLLDEQVIEVLQKAIEQEKMITFNYHSYTLEVSPLGLVYYSRLRRWYIIAEDDHTIKNYYVGNLSNIQISSRSFQYSEGFSVNEWLKIRWGTEFGDPFQVKIRFKNQSQTVSKVQKDVGHRPCQLTSEANGDLLYEDTIVGRNEFLTWLLGFGATAEILEPDDLRQQMRQVINEVLAGYQE